MNVQTPKAGVLKRVGKVAGLRAAKLVQLIIFIKARTNPISAFSRERPDKFDQTVLEWEKK